MYLILVSLVLVLLSLVLLIPVLRLPVFLAREQGYEELADRMLRAAIDKFEAMMTLTDKWRPGGRLGTDVPPHPPPLPFPFFPPTLAIPLLPSLRPSLPLVACPLTPPPLPPTPSYHPFSHTTAPLSLLS